MRFPLSEASRLKIFNGADELLQNGCCDEGRRCKGNRSVRAPGSRPRPIALPIVLVFILASWCPAARSTSG
jgi:hypothetical protein